MKAKDLIKELEKHPDWDVDFSIDISKEDIDYDRRAFGEDVIEIINSNSRKEFSVCIIGQLNY